ncbi:MAG: undecaprenyl/decaprenyl-phosphate alpha-N-acetylglucosaminyl 1-phosphate transferase [Phycisphaerae bacterium]|nr:undecaprenyl/decaprenyl-phosphate alpha-N-acetylglucosaminyl 1-phosphate transferase [Phycisphaerae bacterium]
MDIFIDVLRDVWWIGAVALGVSLIATPIIRFIAYRAKIVDRPDDLLKPHARPVAYLGGLAICVGLLAGIACYVVIMPDARQHWVALGQCITSFDIPALMENPLWQVFAIALACIVITLVGLLDDIRNIPPRSKVMGQILAAAILLAGGVGHSVAQPLFTHLSLPSPPAWVLIPLSAGACLVLVIATCNATNLLDGLDGLCGGVTGIVTLGFLALAVYLATYHHVGPTDSLRIGLCLAMAGAVLGFLPYNIPPASIFMGDAGSMLLGFFVATMMMLFCAEGHARFFVAACAIFALPILDTALAVVRRLLSGKGIFTGDRSHLYDQLVDRGMTVKQVVVLFYILATVAAVIGVTLAQIQLRYAAVIYVVLLVMIWVIFYKKGMIKPEPRKPKEPDSE